MDILERRRAGSLLVAVTAALLPISVVAKEPSPRYTMTVIKEDSHGRRVLNGDYETAIDRITSAGQESRDDYSSQTNLCVAYTKVGYLDSAEEACSAAVAIALERRQSRPRSSRDIPYVDAGDRTDLAVALSNRGVLNAARGNTDEALADFRASLELDAGLSAPGVNIDRLNVAGKRPD